jgi:A/G-specific adenine glycosylase
MDAFADRLLAWWDQHGRKDLPWQHDRTAYRVWISEIMLQQTQVTTVIPYYQKFMDRFPDVATLAAASIDDVLHHWTGLGYYARARNLHKTAGIVCTEHDGEFPSGIDALEALPGIGRSTAGAIAALAQNQRAPILDGNVKRVLTRHHAVAGYPGERAVADQLWQHAEDHTPQDRFADYTQAIMDLGATLCRRGQPDCGHCPMNQSCVAHQTDRVSQFPGKKPKKDKPVRSARMFVLQHGGAVLLEQRPSQGIWGGLWTPPERPADTELADLVKELGFLKESLLEEHVAPVFRHTFTHFHLDIEPVYATIDHQADTVRDSATGWRWHLPGSNEAFGLSAPAVKLLASLDEFALT